MGKKVAILTLPLIYNYGAILQAFALQKSVKSLGAECWLIDKKLPVYPYLRRPLSIISRIYGKYVKHETGYSVFPYWVSQKDNDIISQNTRRFVDKYISPKTKPILKLSKKIDKFDIYLVGSDQVWRKSVTLHMFDYLLGFVAKEKKKCSYAASFGVDYWEFSQSLTTKLKPLFENFDIITVREDSAIDMLREHIGVEAAQVLDPTLLLSENDYCELISDLPLSDDSPFIFSYILDKNPEKGILEEEISCQLNKSLYSVIPKNTPNYGVDLNECVYPAVEEWLRGFRDCEYVVTDSFHGTVFSIIFNKPFFVLRNNKRGNTRLESLLRLFNLNSRIVTNKDDVIECMTHPINWAEISHDLFKYREQSLVLLSDMVK